MKYSLNKKIILYFMIVIFDQKYLQQLIIQHYVYIM